MLTYPPFTPTGTPTQNYPRIFAAMKPGATFGLSHGFLLGYINSVGDKVGAGGRPVCR